MAAQTSFIDAQSDLSLDAIEANVKAADGILPKAERIRTSFVQNGVAGTEVRVRSGDDYRVDTTLGPLTTAEGFFAGVAWNRTRTARPSSTRASKAIRRTKFVKTPIPY